MGTEGENMTNTPWSVTVLPPPGRRVLTLWRQREGLRRRTKESMWDGDRGWREGWQTVLEGVWAGDGLPGGGRPTDSRVGTTEGGARADQTVGGAREDQTGRGAEEGGWVGYLTWLTDQVKTEGQVYLNESLLNLQGPVCAHPHFHCPHDL